MSATTAQSTESLASPLSSQACSSWLLSACSPWPSPPRPPSAGAGAAAAAAEQLEEHEDRPARRGRARRRRPRARGRRPACRRRPRRSWTPDVSRPAALAIPHPSEDLLVGIGHREPHLDRAVHLLAGRREVEVEVARLEPCHRAPWPPRLGIRRRTSPASLTSSSAVSSAPKAAAYCRARWTASRDGGQPGLLERRAVGCAAATSGPDTSTSSSRPRATTRSPDERPARPTVTRVCTDGHRLARRPAVADLEVHGDGGRSPADSTASPAAASTAATSSCRARQRSSAVCRSRARTRTVIAEVGDLRIDQQHRLAADQRRAAGGLGGRAHGGPPEGSAEGLSQTPAARRADRDAHRRTDVLRSGANRRRGRGRGGLQPHPCRLDDDGAGHGCDRLHGGLRRGGEEEEEQVAYCTDENGEIVDDDFCDDGYSGGAGLFFLYLGGFRPGCRWAPCCRRGGTRIDPTRHRRAAAGRAARHRQGQPAGTRVQRRHRQRRRRPVAGPAPGELSAFEERSRAAIVRPGWEAEIEAQGLVYNRTAPARR